MMRLHMCHDRLDTKTKVGRWRVVSTGCRYEDGGRVRPVLHRASLVEMAVVSLCISLSAQARAHARRTTLVSDKPHDSL